MDNYLEHLKEKILKHIPEDSEDYEYVVNAFEIINQKFEERSVFNNALFELIATANHAKELLKEGISEAYKNTLPPNKHK